ncbi:MAG: nucleotide exchange factor GrpE [Alphaproteobacteria bacterium]|nr:nucleotide exchange factor GrpE [Alphaproteobacteria bacterium]
MKAQPENHQAMDQNETNQNENAQASEIDYESFSEKLDSEQNPDTSIRSDVSTAALNRIDELEKQLATMKDQMIRAVAETENIRKRSQREKEDARKFALSSFARDLLNVADNLRRALDSSTHENTNDPAHLKNLITGVEATERELLGVFQRNGIEKIEPLDKPFDPNFHEVMFETPIPNKPAGTVIQIIEPGYILNGRILKPARVGVSSRDSGQPPPPPSDAPPGGNIDTEA